MTRKVKNTLNGPNRKVYITSAVGILAIAGLIYAGVALNEEPNLSIEIPPSPTSALFPSQSIIGMEITKAPTAAPNTQRPKPTFSLTMPENNGGTPSVQLTPAAPTPTQDAQQGGQTQQVTADPLAELSFSGEAVLNWPVLGEVVLDYSMDHTIYHETLNLFRTNDGVLLAAQEGDNVVCAAQGIVTEITEDTMRGVCVTTAIGSGYEITYGQLKESDLKVGDRLEEGDVVGAVAQPTRYYSLEGPHLYFKIEKDGEPVNPMLYLQTAQEEGE